MLNVKVFWNKKDLPARFIATKVGITTNNNS